MAHYGKPSGSLYYTSMIRMLRGAILGKDDRSLVLDVGGVGYRIFCGGALLMETALGENLLLFTHLVVRDDALDLYGFAHEQELLFFELLLTVPGIGPKGALGIIGLAPLSSLTAAIAREDVGYLTKVSGIGKKTAEKIVLELKNKLSTLPDESPEGGQKSSVDADVLSAMQSLGYSEREAREVIQGLPRDLVTLEERITFALKQIRN